MAPQPDSSLAAAVLPGPLYEALVGVYAQDVDGCMLVGGTALAGYYAGHRRSDDLDLFTRDPDAMQATVLAVRALRAENVSITEEQTSKLFYSAACRSRGHAFTIQVVLDGNLFEVGHAVKAADRVQVADLETLLRTKAATLLSRCSEKDLYDLYWLLGLFPDVHAGDLIALGLAIDAGMDAEALLISLVSAPLDHQSCGFSLTQTADEVFADISALKEVLLEAFEGAARSQPTPPIGALIRKLRS